MTLAKGEPMVTGSPGRKLWRLVSVLASVGAVGVDDLSSATRPGLHERAGEGFARRHDIAAQWVRQIQLRSWCESGKQHWGTEQHRDLCFTEDGGRGPDRTESAPWST